MFSMTKAQKFTLIIIVGTIVFLVAMYQTQNVSLDWNGMFNGTIQTVVGTIIGAAVTIWLYRLIYHRGSKR